MARSELNHMPALIAIAMGSFALGSAEFVTMGILPQMAEAVHVSVPAAGDFVSWYAWGVCAGTLFLVAGRRVAIKRLLLFFVCLMVLGNAATALATDAYSLMAGRFIAGLPHGAFFGAATIAAKRLAQPGKEAQAVSIMVLGQTAANMLGVPGGTLLASLSSWRAAFAIIAAWALLALAATWRFVPRIPAITDAGLAGQFNFLKSPGPWFVLIAVLVGNTGVFSWWSYVAPWLTDVGGWSLPAVPGLLVLAGAGMVAGSLAGGRLADRSTPGRMAALGQAVSAAGLLLIFGLSGSTATSALFMVAVSFSMFFISSPQQLLMARVGHGGGELIAGACVQVAYNAGNALGAMVGQAVLNCGFNYAWPSLAGVPFCLVAAILLAMFARRFEADYR